MRQEQLPTEEEEGQAERNALWCIVKSKIEDFEKNRPQDVAEAKQMRNLLLLLLRSNLNHNPNPSSPKSSLDLEKKESNSTDDFDWETKAIRSSILKVHKMLALKGDSISFDQEPLDFTKLGDVSFEEANFMPYITIKDPTQIVPEN